MFEIKLAQCFLGPFKWYTPILLTHGVCASTSLQLQSSQLGCVGGYNELLLKDVSSH